MIDRAGNAIKCGDSAVLLCEVVRVIETMQGAEPGVVVRVCNSDMQLHISAQHGPSRGLVVSEELMQMQVTTPEEKNEPDSRAGNETGDKDAYRRRRVRAGV